MATKSKILDALIASKKPISYLENFGLSYEDYIASDAMSPVEKTAFIKTITAQATDKQFLKIITDFILLEFSRDSLQKCLREDSLTGQLLAQYIMKKEEERFKKFIAEQWKTYPINKAIKLMIDRVIEVASQELFDKKDIEKTKTELSTIILDAYSGLVPAERDRIKKDLIETKFLSSFNDEEEDEDEDFITDWDDPELTSTDIKRTLKRFEQQIRATQWEVGNYLLFQGGVSNAGQRVPHRVDAILTIIKKCRHGEIEPREAWRSIHKTAKEALDNPKPGRKKNTTEFYKGICDDLDSDSDRKQEETLENQKDKSNRRV